MDEINVTFNENKQHAYRMNFNIITFHEIKQSTVSEPKFPKAGKNLDTSHCSWQYTSKNQHIHLKAQPLGPDHGFMIEKDNLGEDVEGQGNGDGIRPF